MIEVRNYKGECSRAQSFYNCYYSEFDNRYYNFYKLFKKAKNYCNGHATELDVYLKKGHKLNDLLNKVRVYNQELKALNIGNRDYEIYRHCYKQIENYIVSLMLLISTEISINNNDLYTYCLYNYELVSSDNLEDLFNLIKFDKESEVYKNENV